MKISVQRPRLYIETYGCQMNIADSEVVAGILRQQGYDLTHELEKADLVLINTCSVRDNAEQRIWGRLDYFRAIKRKKRFLLVGVIGCMAERLGEELAAHEAVDIVAGPDSYRDLPLLLDRARSGAKGINVDLNDIETYSGINPERIDEKTISGFVSIMRGCNNFCTYCIVPYTRGRERSRDPQDIIHEMEHMAANGFYEITLLGQNVNSYSWKNGLQTIAFPQLLEMLAQEFPQLRLRFTTSHPKDISNDLLHVIARYPNVCKHIHLPVQSGSNIVLERMNRKYTREYYLERVAAIRSIIPDCSLTTDLFCGFCGETEEDFQQTLSLMEEVKFDAAYMFKYSERSGTYAAKKLRDDVPENIKIERLNRMIALQNKISKALNQVEIGKTFEVLVEGHSKKSKNDVVGRTSQNKVVVFPDKGFSSGQLVLVKIIKATSATLIGEATV